MLIYVGNINYSPYASDEVFTVVFRDNIQTEDKVSVIFQWTKDSSGRQKANSIAHGTINKVSINGSGEKEIELFFNQKDKTYYWYKGKVSGDKMTLAMWNKGGEEVAKNIQLQLDFI